MARSEARVSVGIWDDPAFLALGPGPQRMYLFLLSQADLAHTGVIALRERRWSRKAAGCTADSVAADLAELEAARFVVIDPDTEELLVRSLIRRDKVFKQPNVLRNARDQLALVSSPLIRQALAEELRRVSEEDMPDGSREIVAGMLADIGNPSSNPSGKGSGNPPGDGKGSGNPSGNPSSVDSDYQDESGAGADALHVSAGGNPSGNPSSNPSGNPTRRAPGERGGVRRVSGDSPIPNPQAVPPPAGDAPAAPQTAAAAVLDDPPPPSVTQRSKRITDAYAAAEPMCKWPAVNGVVIKAIKTDRWTDGEIRDALLRLAAEGRSVTVETLRVELDGLPPGRNGARASPRPSTTDARVRDALAAGARLQAQLDQQQRLEIAS